MNEQQASLCEKCPNTELFLVRIWTLFMQCMLSGDFKEKVREFIVTHQTFSFMTESVAWKSSVKRVFLKISQNSQENTCARVLFLIKLQA